MNYIEINKEDARVTRWLQGGTTVDRATRRALAGLSVEGRITMSADGYELRIAPTPSALKEFDGKVVELTRLGKPASIRLAGDIVEATPIDNSIAFPNWRGIVPDSKPVYTINVNGKWLAEIIKDIDDMVTLEFHKPTQPIVIRSADKFAVLMPMHTSVVSELFDPINNPPKLEESN